MAKRQADIAYSQSIPPSSMPAAGTVYPAAGTAYDNTAGDALDTQTLIFFLQTAYLDVFVLDDAPLRRMQ